MSEDYRFDLIHDAVIDEDDEPAFCRHVDPTGADRECPCVDEDDDDPDALDCG